MNRRLIFQLALAALASPALLHAQPSRKPARVGVLSSTAPETRSVFWDAFRNEMAKLGWTEGRDLAYVYRYARGDQSRFDTLSAELVAEKPDLIFATTGNAAVAVKRATRDIPIVFGFVGDPVGAGLVASLAKPGGNATGMASLGIEVSSKYLQLLKEVRPQLRRVAVLLAGDASARTIDGYERAGRTLGIDLDLVKIDDPKDFGRAFESIARKRPEGVVVAAGLLVIERRMVSERVASLRVPAIYPITEFVSAGGLMSYSAELADNLRRAAGYVDRILKGAKPADLPVEQPRNFELVINLRAAQEQGIRIPQSLLLQATRTID